MRVPHPLRLIPAALVAGAVFVSVGAAWAAAGAGDDVDDVTVGTPMLGDAVAYDLVLSGPSGQSTDVPSPAVQFAWQAGGPFRANDTRVYDSDLLTASVAMPPEEDDVDQAWQPRLTLHHYAAGTSRALGGVATGNYSDALGGRTSIAGVPVLANEGEFQVSLRALAFGAASPVHCLALHGLQGTTLRVGAVVRSSAGCAPDDLPAVTDTNWTVAAEEAVGGWTALRLDARTDGLGRTDVVLDEAGNPVDVDLTRFVSLRAWFADGIPYPVRVEQSYDDGQSARLDLVGWQAGEGARSASPPGEPVRVAMAPRPAWTLDDAGIEHRFPLSKAFQAAALDPRSGLGPFLEGNPGAYVSWAWETSGRDAKSWWFSVSGQAETHTVRIAERSCSPACAAGDVLHAAPVYDVMDLGTAPSTAPPPSLLPAQWPTVAGLLGVWEAFADPAFADRPVTWGFTVGCAFPQREDAKACAPVLDYEIGRSEEGFQDPSPSTDPSAPGVRQEGAFASSILRSGNGDLWHLLELDAGVVYDTGVAPLEAPPSPSPRDGSERGSAVPLLAASFQAPLPRQAGIGALAVLAGLAYWLWPVVKGGGVGLFSRQATADVLRHPQRARLLAAVEANPGIHANALRRLLDVGHGTLHHHVGVLVRHGFIRRVPQDGYTVFFSMESGQRDAAGAVAVKSAGARQVLDAIRRHPGASNLDVAHATGLDPATVHYHVDRLAKAGLVHASRAGRSLRLVAAGTA